MIFKRYEFYASENGKPYKKWTEWFEWDGNTDNPIQLKGFKGNHLRQEFKEE